MRRLDEIVAGLLPGLRAMVVEDGKTGAGVEPAPAVGARWEDAGGVRARGKDDHPRSSQRTLPKRMTGITAKTSMRR